MKAKTKKDYNDFALACVDCEYFDDLIIGISFDLGLKKVSKQLIESYDKSIQDWFRKDLLSGRDRYMGITTNATDERFSLDIIVRKDEIKNPGYVFETLHGICQLQLKQGLCKSVTYK